MKKFVYKVTDPVGMHARPAGILAAEAKKYASRIVMTAGGESVDAAKILLLMGLQASPGDDLIVSVEGSDEAEAAAAMEDVLSRNF